MIRAITLVLLLGQVPARVESLWKVGDALELDAPATLVTIDRAGIHPGKTLGRGAKREVLKVRKVTGVSYLLVYDGWLEGRKLRLRGRAEPEEEADERFRAPEGGWGAKAGPLIQPRWAEPAAPVYQTAPRATPTFQQRLDAAAAEGLPDPKDREEKAPPSADPTIKIPRLGVAPAARTGGSSSSSTDPAQGHDPIHVDGHYDSRGRYVREHYRARSGEANGSHGSSLDGN